MTLEQAVSLRNEHKDLVGKRAKDIDAKIFDVIVVPVDGFERFLSQYRDDLKDVSNDEMIFDYPSREYAVKVIYDYDPEFVDIVYDDVFEYQT